MTPYKKNSPFLISEFLAYKIDFPEIPIYFSKILSLFQYSYFRINAIELLFLLD